MKLLSVSTLMVMMPVRHVAVTIGLNTDEEESDAVAGKKPPLALPPPPRGVPSFLASALPTDALVLFGASELELEIVGALSSASDGLCAQAN